VIGYNNQGIQLLPHNAPIPSYDKKYALGLHKTPWGRLGVALYGLPTHCSAASFGPPRIFKWKGM